jgi:hypothetical protein
MTEPSWTLLPYSPMQIEPVVWREWHDGKQESRLTSSFTPDDPDYTNIMQLVAEGKLTIAPAGE